jgi:hypothetical protein
MATTTTPTITNLMYRVLKATAKAGLTRKGIQEAEFGGNSVNLAKAINPLKEMKLIKLVTIGVNGAADDKKEELIECTAAGRKLAAKAPPTPARGNPDAHLALPKAGGVITKNYLGKEVTVKVTADGFEFKGKKYPSLTAAAKAVRGTEQEVNGWKFFGLVKGEAKPAVEAKPAKAAKTPKAKATKAPKVEAAAE